MALFVNRRVLNEVGNAITKKGGKPSFQPDWDREAISDNSDRSRFNPTS